MEKRDKSSRKRNENKWFSKLNTISCSASVAPSIYEIAEIHSINNHMPRLTALGTVSRTLDTSMQLKLGNNNFTDTDEVDQLYFYTRFTC